MKVCILQFNITGGVYEPLHSAVHPLKCIESDVMWYNRSIVENTELWKVTVKVVLHSKMFNSAFRSSPYSSSKSSSPPPSPLPHCSIISHSIVCHALFIAMPTVNFPTQFICTLESLHWVLLSNWLLPLMDCCQKNSFHCGWTFPLEY